VWKPSQLFGKANNTQPPQRWGLKKFTGSVTQMVE
jgi:hypothetical protein